MELTRENQLDLLDCLLDIGQALLESGAEISRVEDTLSRIGHAYGAKRVEVFVITSIISLSLEFSGADSITETRRIYSSAGTDFYKLESLNQLSREICKVPITLNEFHERLSEINSFTKPFWLILTGSMLAAGSFAVFFGGSIYDGFVAVIFAVEICLFQKYLANTQISTAASNLLISLLTGLGVGLIEHVFPILNTDKILIGDIMLLIPGLAMTNAVRNMLVGNTISGAVRLIESLIWAGALAGGFMTAMLILEILL